MPIITKYKKGGFNIKEPQVVEIVEEFLLKKPNIINTIKEQPIIVDSLKTDVFAEDTNGWVKYIVEAKGSLSPIPKNIQ